MVLFHGDKVGDTNAAQDNMGFILAVSLLVLTMAIACWDFYAWRALGDSYTVSSYMRRWGREYPLLPFTIGVLIGHIFG